MAKPARETFKSFEFFVHFWCFSSARSLVDMITKQQKKASSSTKLKNNETSKEKKLEFLVTVMAGKNKFPF